MGGAAHGTIVLHISPEATLHGPLAPVHNGERIRLSLSQRRIGLLVDEAEHGCDSDFLRPAGP